MKRILSRLSGGRSPSGSEGPSPAPNRTRNASPSRQMEREQEYWRAGPLTIGETPPRFSSNVATGVTWSQSVEFASDPVAWEREFLTCWKQMKIYLARENPQEAFAEVRELLSQISNLLVMEVDSQPEATIGPVLDHIFNEEVFSLVLEWALKMPIFLVPVCQVMLLQNFEDIITRSQSQQHCLLVHKPILSPLLQLLQWCRRSAEERRFQLSNVDKYFVQLLNQLCTKMSEDATLLHFFFVPRRRGDPLGASELESPTESGSPPISPQPRSSRDEGICGNGDAATQHQPFLVFSLLVPYLYSAGDIGQMARDALYLIMTVSSNDDLVANHIALNSNFCPVLAAGLSGCFSELPRDACSASGCDPEDFHKLHLPADIGHVKEIYDFYQALLFCNAIMQVSHREVQRQIIRYFYNGFLLEVFAPALQTGVETLDSKCVYLHLCFDAVTEPTLVQALVKLLIVAETATGGATLLETIVAMMNSNERLCRVVLSLLTTLINLRCEDLMWSCLSRYLLPRIPLKKIGRRFNFSTCLEAATVFLDCIPDSVRSSTTELNSEETFDTYAAEASARIAETEYACKDWIFKYDGVSPNQLFAPSSADGLLSARQPFLRLSSARSSHASTRWNRYFVRQNRSAHATQDSVLTDAATAELPPLNMLGEPAEASPPSQLPLGVEPLDLQELDAIDGEFYMQFETMADPRFNYHFAYEGISESDGSTSRRNSSKDEEEVGDIAPVRNAANRVGRYASAVQSTDWSAATTPEALTTLLAALPKSERPLGARLPTLEENISLIASRLQYINELKAEREREGAESDGLPELEQAHTRPSELLPRASLGLLPKSGLPLTCCGAEDRCPLMESLMGVMHKVGEFTYGYSTSLQLAGVLISLMSYPQPLLVFYLLLCAPATNKPTVLPKLPDHLKKLKLKIDASAVHIEGFDELLNRGLRHKVSKAERLEMVRDPNGGGRLGLGSEWSHLTAHNSNRSNFKFTHKSIDITDGRTSDAMRARNCAYAALMLSQLSQIGAAFSLRHAAITEFSEQRSI